MKIRWNDRSVRLRIAPSELETLARGEGVGEELQLAGGAWRAELARGTTTELVFRGATLRFTLSEGDFARLMQPDAEGVYFSGADGIRFYVEKDFPCAHPRAEEAREKSETFQAPPGFEARKNSSS